MTAERSRELESFGFEGTNVSRDALLEQLTEYKVKFGHCPVRPSDCGQSSMIFQPKSILLALPVSPSLNLSFIGV
jgi:hypothetical protein